MAQQEQRSALPLGIVALDSKQGSLLLCLQMASLCVAVLAQQACTVELSCTTLSAGCWEGGIVPQQQSVNQQSVLPSQRCVSGQQG